MNNKPDSRRILAGALFALTLASVAASQASSGQRVTVSIPAPHTTSKERVVGFEIHVTSGKIAALPKIPIGWNLTVDNDPSWNTTITASIEVGAAAVGPDYFRDFIVVEKDESLGVPFWLHGEIVVTEDFKTQRRVRITPNDFAMKAVANH